MNLPAPIVFVKLCKGPALEVLKILQIPRDGIDGLWDDRKASRRWQRLLFFPIRIVGHVEAVQALPPCASQRWARDGGARDGEICNSRTCGNITMTRGDDSKIFSGPMC